MSSSSAESGFQRIVDALTEAARTCQARLAQVTRALERSNGLDAMQDDAAQHLQRVETWAIEGLASHGGSAVRAVSALRIANDLRRIDQLLSDLARRLPHPMPALPDDIADQVHHVIELTLVQLGASQDCLTTRDLGRIQRVVSEETFLDDWYDILLGDVLDELAEKRLSKADLIPVLTLARTLERIGDHARDIAINAAALAGVGEQHVDPS